jgi:hypothetical protein
MLFWMRHAEIALLRENMMSSTMLSGSRSGLAAAAEEDDDDDCGCCFLRRGSWLSASKFCTSLKPTPGASTSFSRFIMYWRYSCSVCVRKKRCDVSKSKSARLVTATTSLPFKLGGMMMIGLSVVALGVWFARLLACLLACGANAWGVLAKKP